MSEAVVVAIIGVFAGVVSGGATAWFGRRKTKADTELVEANTELVEANALTVVIEGLRGEVTRLSSKVNDLGDEVAQVQRDLAEQKIITARIEAEKDLVQHRFEVLVDHHGTVVRVATDAGVQLPPPPPEIAHYLLG